MLIFDTKVLLFDALKSLTPTGVFCTFAETGDTSRRQQVWLGATTEDDIAPVAMRNGPRKPTNITAYVDVNGVVITPGNPIDAERGAYALRSVVKEACATLDKSAVPGLLDVRPESSSVETSETTDGAFSALTVRVRIRGRVTQ